MIVYRIDERKSFEHVEAWLSEVHQHASDGIVLLLVGNKCREQARRSVSCIEAETFAGNMNFYLDQIYF